MLNTGVCPCLLVVKWRGSCTDNPKGGLFRRFPAWQVRMSVSVTVPHPDLATTLQQAVAALTKVIESKPEMDRLLAEMVRISGQALKAGGAGVWVAENVDRPELVLEHNLAQLQLMASGAAISGIKIAIRRCAREAKPLIVPAFFVDAETVDTPVNPSPFELLFVPMKLHGKVAMVLMMALPPAGQRSRAFTARC